MLTREPDKDCIRIEVELRDGTIFRASGDRATKIWHWLLSAETQMNIHGAKFVGDGFEISKKTKETT
jgi:hypothetical protein